MKGKLFFLCCILYWGMFATGQPVSSIVVVKDVLEESRIRLYRNLVSNTISKNLSLPLSDSIEENWMDAFYAIELIQYQPLWLNSKIQEAFLKTSSSRTEFQISLMELVNANYPFQYEKEVQQLKKITASDNVFAMCVEYICRTKPLLKASMMEEVKRRMAIGNDSIVLQQLHQRLLHGIYKTDFALLKQLLHHNYFPGAKLVFSLQRKNRDYPGLAIVRDSTGNFVKDENGFIFSVPQLARSITNTPFYFRNGNTPQGIFRMYGTAVSKGNFIGPTPNIQLTMPFETSIAHFMNDSTIKDSVWTESWYRNLLPDGWKNNPDIFGTFYAGKIGRNEIIAHGTTVNPAYYKLQPFYPQTPTFGCLCSKEIWNEEDGKLLQSDQQKLINALQKAGGANGYLIVLELDDEQRPVLLAEIEKYLQ